MNILQQIAGCIKPPGWNTRHIKYKFRSKQDFAAACNITPFTLSRILHGHQDPTLATLAQMLAAADLLPGRKQDSAKENLQGSRKKTSANCDQVANLSSSIRLQDLRNLIAWQHFDELVTLIKNESPE